MAKKSVIILFCLVIFALTSQRSVQAISLISIVNIVRTVTSFMKSVSVFGNTLGGIIPHNFSFGGHITSSERACSIRAWIWYEGPPLYVPLPCPDCFFWPLGGRAIEVGPPVPSPGKVIDFPWISQIYRNYQEDRVGPWALGLGFTPFPLNKINDALGSIMIFYGAGWIDHIRIDCQASGEEDASGNDIYKVILKLGTSPN